MVISDQYQKRGLGKLIIKTQIDLAKSLGSYKITLNCKDDLMKTYKKIGFVAEEGNANFLVIRVLNSK